MSRGWWLGMVLLDAWCIGVDCGTGKVDFMTLVTLAIMLFICFVYLREED
jgi:hypothetical protein